MVLAHNVTLANDTLVLCVRLFPDTIHADHIHRVWISSDDVKAVAEKGFKLIHAASDYFYLVSGLCCASNPQSSQMRALRTVVVEVGSETIPLGR